ncbi:hypothetical protein [Izhakiella australiensis]|nr:hypothetical protein [Izhakiella australiensis]
MSAVNHQFSTAINFGRTITESWRRSATSVEASLNRVGSSLTSLRSNQARLSTEIRRSMLAGQNLSHLKRQYEAISERIRSTIKQQQVLNTQLRAAKRLEWFKGKGLRLQHFAGSAVKKGLVDFRHGLLVMLGDALVAPITANQQTVRKMIAARGYGVDMKTYGAWDSLASQFGMSGDSVGAMYAQYRDKAKAHRQTGGHSEWDRALTALGLDASQLSGLSSLNQFNRIIAKAQGMQDQSEAGSALSILLGPDAPRLLAFVQQSGEAFSTLVMQQRQYNMVTQQGTEGAFQANAAFSNLRTVFSSAVTEVSGVLGKELAPKVSALAKDLAEWFKAGGIQKITGFITNELYPRILAFASGICLVGKVIYAIASKLSFLLPNINDDKKHILTMAADGKSLKELRAEAKKKGVLQWFDSKVNRPGVIENIKKQVNDGYFRSMRYMAAFSPTAGGAIRDQLVATQLEKIDGKDSDDAPLSWQASLDKARGELKQQSSEKGIASADKPASSTDGMGRWPTLSQRLANVDRMDASLVNDNRSSSWQITINTLPGQSPTDIVDTLYSRAAALNTFNGNNEMYDRGGVW